MGGVKDALTKQSNTYVTLVLLPKSAVYEDTLPPGLPHHLSSLVLDLFLNPLAEPLAQALPTFSGL